MLPGDCLHKLSGALVMHLINQFCGIFKKLPVAFSQNLLSYSSQSFYCCESYGAMFAFFWFPHKLPCALFPCAPDCFYGILKRFSLSILYHLLTYLINLF